MIATERCTAYFSANLTTMRTLFLSIIAISVVVSLTGCDAITGKEVARMAVDSLSTPDHLVMGQATLPLKQGEEIAFWSHMDLGYDGDAALRFRVRVLRGDSDLTLLEIDPLRSNITTGETKSTIGDHTQWSFTGKNHVWTVPEDATYTFKAILTAEENSSLRINKAELLLKQ